jgi:hypothetical protein
MRRGIVSRFEMLSKVGPDGVLRLNVPLPAMDAGREVRVTVEPSLPEAMTQEDWQAGVLRLAGAWQGEFARPDPGALEEREPLA